MTDEQTPAAAADSGFMELARALGEFQEPRRTRLLTILRELGQDAVSQQMAERTAAAALRAQSDSPDEDAVKAGMARRINAMHSVLTELVDTFENDPFNGNQTRYVIKNDGASGYSNSVRVGGDHIVSVGLLRRAKHAISEAASEPVGASSPSPHTPATAAVSRKPGSQEICSCGHLAWHHAGACEHEGCECRAFAFPAPETELLKKIEDAIKLAAKLGDDAFDFIEGRGLHADRLEIQAAIQQLHSRAAECSEYKELYEMHYEGKGSLAEEIKRKDATIAELHSRASEGTNGRR